MDYQPCSADGFHNVTALNLKGERDPCTHDDESDAGVGFKEVYIKCSESHVIEFIQDCAEDPQGRVASEYKITYYS